MFWGKKKTEDDKEKQLKQLKNAFPSIRRPQNDDALFEIRFMVDNQSNALRIFIPSDFPQTRPVLQVAGPVNHPWLDQFKQVNGCQKLMNWGKFSVLLEVVEESLSALMNGGTTSTVGSSSSTPSAAAGSADPRSSLSFYPGGAGGAGGAYPVPPASSSSNSNRNSFAVPVDPRGSASYPMPMAAVNPPSPSGAMPYHHASIPSSSSYGQLAAEGIAKPSSSSPMVVDPSTLSKGPAAEGNTRSPIALPDIPRSFPELEGMTDAQLEKMLRDDAAVAEHVDKHTASVEMMRSMIDDLRQSNADAATANVLMNEELLALKQRAAAAQAELRHAADEYNKHFQSLANKVTIRPEAVMQELNMRRQALDAASEEIGRRLVGGEMDLLSEYMEARVKYHALSTKVQLVKVV